MVDVQCERVRLASGYRVSRRLAIGQWRETRMAVRRTAKNCG
jgi:hypothetical protein